MRSRVIPETDRPLSRLQLVRTVHLANRQDGIYPLPRHLGQNLVAKVAGFKMSISPVCSSNHVGWFLFWSFIHHLILK